MEQINLTNTLVGLAAIQRCMAGEDILFTRLEIGDGILTNTDVSGMTGLINKTSEFPLGAIQTEDNEVIRLRSNISNKDISEDLVIREYGIYAKFGNEQEFLFAYLNVGESTTPLPNERIGRYELNRDFVLYIGNSTHVDFTSNGNLVYVAVNEYKDDMTRKANVVGTIEDLKNSKKYKIGDVVEVLGYYTPGDGGGHPRQKKPSGYTGADAVIGADGSIWGIVHNGEINVSWFGLKSTGDMSVQLRKVFDFCNVNRLDLVQDIDLNIESNVEMTKVVSAWPDYSNTNYYFNKTLYMKNASIIVRSQCTNIVFNKIIGTGVEDLIIVYDTQGNSVIDLKLAKTCKNAIVFDKAYTYTLNLGIVQDCAERCVWLKEANAITINNGRVGGNFSKIDKLLDPTSSDIGIHIGEGGMANVINGTNIEFCKRTPNSIGIIDEGKGTVINDVYLESISKNFIHSTRYAESGTYNVSYCGSYDQITKESFKIEGTNCTLNLKSSAVRIKEELITDGITTAKNFTTNSGININGANVLECGYIKQSKALNNKNMIDVNKIFYEWFSKDYIESVASDWTFATTYNRNSRHVNRYNVKNNSYTGGQVGFRYDQTLTLKTNTTYNLGVGFNCKSGSAKIYVKVQDNTHIYGEAIHVVAGSGDMFFNLKYFRRLETKNTCRYWFYVMPLEANTEVEFFTPYISEGVISDLKQGTAESYVIVETLGKSIGDIEKDFIELKENSSFFLPELKSTTAGSSIKLIKGGNVCNVRTSGEDKFQDNLTNKKLLGDCIVVAEDNVWRLVGLYETPTVATLEEI